MKLLHNARIHTLDPARPAASAIILDGERIKAVGGDELLTECEHAECEDMGGRVILPGLTDAHIHLQEYALSLQVVDCEAETKEEILRRVAERVRQTPHGGWVRGHGWNQNWLPLGGTELAQRRGPGRGRAAQPGLFDGQIPACFLGQ